MAILNHGSTLRTADGGQTTTTIVTAANIGTYGIATNSTYYVGTTQNIFNRASGAQTLTGVSIDGNAANITAYTINQNVGTANAPSFAGATLTSTLSITGGDGLRAFKAGAATVTSHLYWANTTNTVAYNWQLDENNNAAMWGYTSAWGKLLTVTSAGAFSASGDARAPIFYDSNDTAYYVDPNSISRLSSLRVYSAFDTASSDVYANMRVINDTAFSDGMYIGYANAGSGVTRLFGGGATTGALIKYSDYTAESNSFRAPIFYDSDNTAYYLDAANSTTSLLVAGKVGIGTTSPANKLDVVSATANNGSPFAASFFSGDDSSASWRCAVNLQHNANTTIVIGSSVGLSFAPLSSTSSSFYGSAAIKAVRPNITANNQDTDLAFWTRTGASNSTVDTEKVRITGTGNVGIGIAAPDAKLHIYHSGQPQVSDGLYASMILDTDSTSNYQRIRYDVGATPYWGLGREGSTNDFILSGRISSTFSDNVFRIQQSTGNVGIGVASPSQKLDVSGAINASTYVYAGVFYDNDNTVYNTNPSGTSNLVGLTVANTITGSVSGNAATAGGLAVHTGTNNEANKIVRTDVNGYIQAGWINTTSGDQGTSAIDRVYASYDGYIRYYSPTNFRTVLDVPTRGGSGASGNWAINATNITAYTINQSVGTANSPTFVGLTLSPSAASQFQLNSPSGTQGLWIRAGYDSDGTATPSASALNVVFQASGSSSGTFSFVSGNTKVVSISGSALNSLVAIQQSGNQVLNASNYVGYSAFTASLTSTVDARAPIFYDSNDTAYYLDAANTTLSLKTRSSIVINNASAPNNLAMLNIGYNGGGETRVIDIQGGWSSGENKSITFTHGSGSTNIVAQINAQHNGPGSKLRWGKLYHSGDSSTYTMELISESTTSAYLTVVGSVRAPIFYDSDNTAYYLDPANSGTSLLVAGNVGIGITSPSAKLHIYNGSSHFETTSTGAAVISSGLYALQIAPLRSRIATAGSYYGGIAFNHLLNYGGGTTYNVAPQAWIGTRLQDSAGSERDYLVFATKPGTGVTGTGNDIPIERMCIDYNGLVGIGTTSPTSKLHVYNSAATDTTLESGTSGTTGKLIFKTSDNADLNKYIMQESFYMILNGHANEGFKFRDSASNVLLSIFGAANAYASRVGIGTQTPAQKLHVSGIGYSDTDFRAPIFYDSNNTAYYVDAASTSILDATRHNSIVAGSTSGMSNGGAIAVYSGGSPYISFHDGGAARTAYFQEAGGRFYFGEVTYTESEGSFRAPIFYDSNNTAYYIDAASTSRLNIVHSNYYIGEITDSGNGDANAPFRFESDYSGWSMIFAGTPGSTNGWGTFWAGNDNPAYYYFGASNPNEYVFVGAGSLKASIDLDNGQSYFATSLRSPIFYDSDNTAYYINPAGNSIVSSLTFDSNITIYKHNDRNLLIQGGGGTDAGLLGRGSSGQFAFQVYGSGGGDYGFLNAAWGGWDIQKTVSGNLYLNANGTYYLNPASTTNLNNLTVAGDVRSPIFYDSNNTAYYIDAASGSNLNTVNANRFSAPNNGLISIGDDSATQTYNDGSTRSRLYVSSAYPAITLNSTVTSGNGNHGPTIQFTFNGYDSSRQWVIGSGGTGQQLDFGTAQPSNKNPHEGIAGYSGTTCMRMTVAGNVGIGGSWGFYGTVENPSYRMHVQGTGYASGDFRAPIFYDSSDTAYYLDPRSTSVLSGLKLNGIDNEAAGTGSDAILWINKPNNNDWAIRVSGNLEYLLKLEGATSHTYNIQGMANGSEFWRCGTDLLYHNSNIRAPIFYDSANTAYYINPDGVSNLVGLTVVNQITGSISGNAGGSSASCTGNAVTATTSTNVSSPDGDRNPSTKLPTTNARNVRFDFSGAGAVGGTGNYAGVMTYAPWDGTSASTGDSSYQLAFLNETGVNASGVPGLSLRNGINSTWGSWYRIITSGNIASQTVATAGSCTGNSATTTLATKATRANGNFYIDDNYGNTVVGVYSASRYQGVFAMGDSYKLVADGSTTGNLYGIAWSHQNAGGAAANLASHGLLILENGVFKGAWGGGSLRTPSDVRGTLFYDWDNTGYYCDPASTSNLYAITAASNITAAQYYTGGWFRNNASGNGLYNEATGQHFYSDSGNYWNVASSASAQGIRLRTGGHAGTVRGYFYATDSNDVGFLNQDGNWRLRVVGGDYSLADGSSMRAQLFYDSNNTGYYVDPASTSNLAGLTVANTISGSITGSAGSVAWTNVSGRPTAVSSFSNDSGYITSGGSISGSSGSCTGNAASVTDGVYLSTNQSISGVKTFSSPPVATNIAKAWVHYNMNNNTINASYNVSSVTDNGTGVCTVNFSTSMVDANYVVAGTATYGYDDQDIYAMILAVPRRSTAQQAGSCRLATEFIHAAQVYDCVAVRAVFYR